MMITAERRCLFRFYLQDRVHRVVHITNTTVTRFGRFMRVKGECWRMAMLSTAHIYLIHRRHT